ncbi:MAG TPA: hypothetical protein VE621_03120 [Bryobacteraceae bacterium]|nr:hypothetical protein [Bryobacteraceae bacterium]
MPFYSRDVERLDGHGTRRRDELCPGVVQPLLDEPTNMFVLSDGQGTDAGSSPTHRLDARACETYRRRRVRANPLVGAELLVGQAKQDSPHPQGHIDLFRHRIDHTVIHHKVKMDLVMASRKCPSCGTRCRRDKVTGAAMRKRPSSPAPARYAAASASFASLMARSGRS